MERPVFVRHLSCGTHAGSPALWTANPSSFLWRFKSSLTCLFAEAGKWLNFVCLVWAARRPLIQMERCSDCRWMPCLWWVAIMRLAQSLALGGMSRQVKSLILCVGFYSAPRITGWWPNNLLAEFPMTWVTYFFVSQQREKERDREWEREGKKINPCCTCQASSVGPQALFSSQAVGIWMLL